MPKQYKSFAEFWPYYVSEHSRPLTRGLHFCGTLLLIPVVVLATVASAYYLLLLPLVGYGFAWLSHALVEKNRPATFTYPLWSLLADFKMFAFTWLGKMSAEVEKYAEEDKG